MSKKAIVIGCGIGGLGSAIRLQSQGYAVSVYESNAYPGGKLSQLEQAGYRFDAGPSLFTMPHFVTELFQLAGEDPKKYFRYKKLPIVCEYFYEDGTHVTAFAERPKFVAEMSEKLGESPQQVNRFLDKSAELYGITSHVFLHRSLHKLGTYLRKDTLQSILQLYKLNIFNSMHEVNGRFFQNPKTVQFFNRYATYNGSDPYQAPGTLNIIPHLENHFGAFFPEGGMYQITLSLFELAKRMGVEFCMGAKVSGILTQNGRAVGIQMGNEKIPAEVVVCNMDMVNAYKTLLKDEKQPKLLLKQPKSSSALIFYWGIKKRFPQLDLHNIFFSDDYQGEFAAMFKKGTFHPDPTVYVNISSKEHPADAPEGSENWFTMINAPNDSGQDWEALIPYAKSRILEKLSRLLQTDVGALIETEAILSPPLIEQKTSSAQGALYGNSSNNPFTAFLRHPNFSPYLKDLYFCGGSVHPGGGIPLSLLSAKIVGDLVGKA